MLNISESDFDLRTENTPALGYDGQNLSEVVENSWGYGVQLEICNKLLKLTLKILEC